MSSQSKRLHHLLKVIESDCWKLICKELSLEFPATQKLENNLKSRNERPLFRNLSVDKPDVSRLDTLNHRYTRAGITDSEAETIEEELFLLDSKQQFWDLPTFNNAFEAGYIEGKTYLAYQTLKSIYQIKEILFRTNSPEFEPVIWALIEGMTLSSNYKDMGGQINLRQVQRAESSLAGTVKAKSVRKQNYRVYLNEVTKRAYRIYAKLKEDEHSYSEPTKNDICVELLDRWNKTSLKKYKKPKQTTLLKQFNISEIKLLYNQKQN
jgi:hypothetical protein